MGGDCLFTLCQNDPELSAQSSAHTGVFFLGFKLCKQSVLSKERHMLSTLLQHALLCPRRGPLASNIRPRPVMVTRFLTRKLIW